MRAKSSQSNGLGLTAWRGIVPIVQVTSPPTEHEPATPELVDAGLWMRAIDARRSAGEGAVAEAGACVGRRLIGESR